ncbi:MFS transporter [Pseudonocardia halophobica]|uniref:MFS transporter n=1 Tax=Pseudonocardia halophobica TaxID=29401 RepID=UPI003D8B48B1
MANGGASGRGTLVLVAMTVANAMILIDQTAVPLALPDIAQDLGVRSQSVQWVLTASLLPLAGLTILGGRLGDLLGRRKVFVTGAVLFAGASALGGLAPSFAVLLAARVLQGAGGALMLPTTVAIVSSAFSRDAAGRALGTMGGIAAVAGALGPTIGGLLTSVLSWRAVLLINLPLLVVTLACTMRAVPADVRRTGRVHVDLSGAVAAGTGLVALVFGLGQTTAWGWSSPGVIVPLVVCVVAFTAFVLRERRAHDPLMNFALLRRSRNYLGATISQGLAGMAEMGLGLIFPLLLILNLGMDPAVAGLALIPTTVPMVVLAPLVGRWYDRSGGRPPLVVGFGCLALAGVLLALGAGARNYPWLLPGLLVYGVGLAIILTVNDPVSIDTVPERDHGQASGVSATAEQGGGAVGIALLYAVFHSAYLSRLHADVAGRNLPPLDDRTGPLLRDALNAAEQFGLHPDTFDPRVARYLGSARVASDFGYSVTFLATTVLALVGLVATAVLVRRPERPAVAATESETSAP